MALSTAYEVPRAQPVIIAVADQTPASNAVEGNDCNCGVPPTASKPVKARLQPEMRDFCSYAELGEYVYLEDYWPCAGGFSVVNAIDTSLGGLINSGLARRRTTVLIETVAESRKEEWSPTRKISAMIIGIHIFALFFGRVFWGQWLASLIAITTGCVVLCQFNRCAYTTAAVLYMIGMIFDILSVLFWIMYAETLAEDITDDDIEEDQAERTIRLFSLTPAVGALCLLLGAIAASAAVYSWQNSGALDAETIIESSLIRATQKAHKKTCLRSRASQVGCMAPEFRKKCHRENLDWMDSWEQAEDWVGKWTPIKQKSIHCEKSPTTLPAE